MSGEALFSDGVAGGLSRALALVGGLVALVSLAAAAADSVSTAESPPDPMLAEMGAAPFERYCASCHGAKGEGDGSVVPALATAPADLTRIAARRDGEFPRGEIGRIIDGRFRIDAHGTREMPVWGARFAEAIADPGLSEEVSRGTIAVLVEYLASIQTE